GAAETFAVYRIAYGAGMERVFYINSPKISKIEVTRTGKVRQSKLYYLRGAFGKAAKVKERIDFKKKSKKAAKIIPPAEEKTVVEDKTEE
ncbi:MAG: 50S ribosomal protein L19, partial [Simkaniaceae bacterium]|nr:50S ribosomal protein L19 [Simkaniaceae bacterium]